MSNVNANVLQVVQSNQRTECTISPCNVLFRIFHSELLLCAVVFNQVTDVQRKRKRSSSGSKPPKNKVHDQDVVSLPPEPPLEALDLVPRPSATIDPEDLPAVRPMPVSFRSSETPPQDDSPLMIHNHTVEEYQKIYHEVVDNMLYFKTGRQRPYSLALGRAIKQKLWERLNRPAIVETVGQVNVEVSYGSGTSPPLYDVDVAEEPKPRHYQVPKE
ncbi:unnamed protein product [Menidia menidia]|uniref:(Atlantic silverside) hypothetical protein n=1 Tax=Menidia menidia TaxID=238744 RepID=A0A8S4ARH3_9TELE|nr:unnamed protein product [Menidia menidia]